jgi:Ca-activated chloride channel family protein
LSTLAELTHGQYYEAASQQELRRVYQDLGSSTGYRTTPREIWARVVSAGLVFALITAGLGLVWTSRVP